MRESNNTLKEEYMRRIATFLVFLFWLCGMLALEAAGATALTCLTFPNLTGKPGGQVTMGLHVSNADPFEAFQADVTYPADKLTAISVEETTFAENLGAPVFNLHPPGTTPGVIRIAMAGAYSISGSGELFQIVFQVIGTAGQLADVTLTNMVDGPQTGCLISGSISIAKNIWHVDDNIPASGNGLSWAAAFKSIQEAVDAAASGDEIWVKAATYVLTGPILINENVAIYGGFAGAETERGQRNWRTYITTVDGGGVSQCFDISANAMVDGLVITRGYALNGGGAHVHQSYTASFGNCRFWDNRAGNSGGAIVGDSCQLILDNCAFSGNKAISGATVYSNGANLTIQNCTFSGNGDGTTVSAGAVGGSGGSVTVKSSILWGDAPNEIGISGATVTVTYSDVQGGYTGAGNLASDPLLTDSASRILNLRPTSPCIDLGVASTSGLAARDLDGNPRVADGNGDSATRVDMGAYEYQPEVMAFVNSYYENVLDRTSDPGGAQTWTTEIERLVSLGVGINEGFLALAKNFFNCAEYLGKGKTDTDFVKDLYWTFLNREPSPDDLTCWTGVLAQGLTRNAVMYCFAYSTEFSRLLESAFFNIEARPEDNLLNDFYRGLLARLPDAGGFNSWLGLMRKAQCACATQVQELCRQLATLFTGSQEYLMRNRNNSQYVEDLYDAVLRRGADPSGFAHWVSELDSGSMSRKVLLNAFVNSTEFQGRIQAIIDAGCMQ
jgi:hypothetical protein